MLRFIERIKKSHGQEMEFTTAKRNEGRYKRWCPKKIFPA
jgi:hypothetical protein